MGSPTYTASPASFTFGPNVIATTTKSDVSLTTATFIACDPGDKAIRAFNGKIATAMVYNSALSLADITATFNAQKSAFGL